MPDDNFSKISHYFQKLQNFSEYRAVPEPKSVAGEPRRRAMSRFNEFFVPKFKRQSASPDPELRDLGGNHPPVPGRHDALREQIDDKNLGRLAA